MSAFDLAAEGPGAPPRTNGEIVFDAPWQSRAFGVAAALAEAGRLDWGDFQAALIGRVAESDAAGEDTGEPSGYWACWLDALGDVARVCGHVDDATWRQRAHEFAERAPGHDHAHDHAHDR